MASQQTISNWPKELDDPNNSDGLKFKQFLKHFILKFIAKLEIASKVVENEESAPLGKTGKGVKVAFNFLGSAASDTATAVTGVVSSVFRCSAIVNSIIQLLGEGIVWYLQKCKREKLKELIDKIAPDNDDTTLAISMMALEILFMFEQQIHYISDEIDYHYIKKFANDMTDAIIEAFVNEKSKPVDRAKFAIKSIACPGFSKKNRDSCLSKGTGSELKVLAENGEKKIKTSKLFKNIGIRTVEDNTVKYYKLKGEKSDICEYGFRQKSFLEGSGSINKESYELLDSSAIEKNFKYQTQLGKVENVEDLKHYAQNILNEVLVDEKSLIVTMLDRIKEDVQSLNDDVMKPVQANIEKILETLNNVSDINNSIDDIKKLTQLIKDITEKNNSLLDRFAEQYDKVICRLESIDSRTERIEGTTERIDDRTERIDGRTERIEDTTERIDDRTDRIDGKTERIDSRTDTDRRYN
ncbi:uncharacterized protein TRIADDRAFT_62502 [Trichoplax adhaerens]|uniref:t-SNARE coiled-coil homology domain-containing protein n=1 Tax=Trichoplax adhaerens TaxID=10228 RepID=B3SDZ9_TRIAD|nr:predicted protein [Trichoplax adhaerens]EDV19047.1 predicted protein [Trichoplax adhaerens]|eukprot:XP_002118468.1 predicted protein [Trichoplax adhaerens]